MHIQRHTHTSTHVLSAHKRNGNNQAQEPGWEGRKKGFVRDLAHTKKKCQKKPIFTNLKNRFEHIELPAKLLDYFLRSNKSNINQCVHAPSRYRMCVCAHVCAVCSFSVGERGWDRIGFSFYGPHIDNPILTSRGKRGSVGKSERVS